MLLHIAKLPGRDMSHVPAVVYTFDDSRDPRHPEKRKAQVCDQNGLFSLFILSLASLVSCAMLMSTVWVPAGTEASECPGASNTQEESVAIWWTARMDDLSPSNIKTTFIGTAMYKYPRTP